jgi:hypothetical protein
MNLPVASDGPLVGSRRASRGLFFAVMVAFGAFAPLADAPPGAAPDPAAAPPVPEKPPTVTAEPTAPNPPQPPPVPKAERPPADDPLGPQYKKLNTNVWLHTGANINNPKDPKKLNDIYGYGEVDLLFSGQVHRNLLWQADFVATWPGASSMDAFTSRVEILDLIAKIEGSDNLINLWFGRMLVPSDRANFSGFWFAAPWTYPGFFIPGAPPLGPMQGPFGRNDGATLWGQFLDGRLKYYAGAYDLQDASQSPLYSTRLNIALLTPEPGYYHSSTYYGEDHLSLGLSYQHKNNGSVGTMGLVDDWNEFSADLLFEKNLGTGGVFDLEGAFYAFGGDYNIAKNMYFGLVSWMTPDRIGWGKLQPLVRYQGATPKGGGDAWSIIDAQLAWVIDGYAARITGGYTHQKTGPAFESNTIFFGIQLQR